MIRRELTAPSGEKIWLLISQVEHARVSGELAHYWHEGFSSDVINAIAHHDDGWGPWEANPKLNPEIGAPFSFLEMPVPAALVIWDHSIAAAGEFGPLAAYIVAGHFYNLLSNSDHAQDPLAVAWLAAKRKHRTSWLDDWMRKNPSRSLEEAKQAQQMLIIADLFSLWLCCDCPTDGLHDNILEQSAMKLQTETLLKQFRFAVKQFAMRNSTNGARVDCLDWTVDVQPCPFRESPLRISANCIAVPVSKYLSWQDVEAASWPVELRWTLGTGEPPNDPPA